MSNEGNKALVRRFYGVNQHNLAEIDELLASDYVHHDPNLPPEMQHGRENYKQGFVGFFNAFPDLRSSLEAVIAEDDQVATRLTWTGTHLADLMGIPATGKQVSFTMMTIHRIADGKIAEGWVNFDAMTMMQQLGVLPAPAQG